jgi:formate/nitrite transporter FocA (FNT family)
VTSDCLVPRWLAGRGPNVVCACDQAAAAGASKAALSPRKTFLMGILGGAFIGFGSFLALTVGAACPGLSATNPGLQKMVYGAFGLPFGLLLVLLCGAELFTGNTALVTAAVSIENSCALWTWQPLLQCEVILQFNGHSFHMSRCDCAYPGPVLSSQVQCLW